MMPYIKQEKEISDQEFLKVGDRLIFMGHHFVLAHVGSNLVCLVNIHTGYSWQPPYKVENLKNISDDEFEEISGGFELPTAYVDLKPEALMG